ncbi:response regulator [Candidatus Acetothermia bacterium]|nr:response regulator [Candidatus Acetothermia bacterium]
MTSNKMHGPGRLLVVEDNKVNRILLLRGLEQQGHVVTAVENGKQALKLLHSQPFDIVLLDIEMPEMNGFQVLETCLQDTHLREIPIIMTSAMDELDSVVKCIEMGAEDYLTKPLNTVLLRARVNASLEKKRLRDQQRKLFDTVATSEVAEELISKGFSLGGKHVDASVMFTDIRSFTSIAESQDPSETMELLNTYFTLMFEPIKDHGGIVNQIVGDEIMAIFRAPIPRVDHREQAVFAAIEMLELLKGFNQEQALRNRVQIQIGVGIASGRVIAGYTGTQQRAIFTCIGDTVNVASRIQDHTKIIGQPLLISENTQQSLPTALHTELLDSIVFKGKSQPVSVYSVKTEPAD